MIMLQQKSCHINQTFYGFINEEVLPSVDIDKNRFWNDFQSLNRKFKVENQRLLLKRYELQTQINEWHNTVSNKELDPQIYQQFLREIGYIVDQGDDFNIETTHVDSEIATIAGSQMVVPVNNTRFALKAANARRGSFAFQAASKLIFSGKEQPCGCTEPELHHYKALAKEGHQNS